MMLDAIKKVDICILGDSMSSVQIYMSVVLVLSQRVVRTMPADMIQGTCYTKEYNQTIFHKECIPRVITNKMCFGSCLSISMPSYNKGRTSECSSCSHKESEIKEVKLNCPKRKRKYKVKKQIIVHSCKCLKYEECG